MRRTQDATSRVYHPRLSKNSTDAIYAKTLNKIAIAKMWLCLAAIGARGKRSGTLLWPPGTACSYTQIALARDS